MASKKNLIPLDSHCDEARTMLQEEISLLKQKLNDTIINIRGLESQIHARYSGEITHISKLGSIYKDQKQKKKQALHEQKRKNRKPLSAPVLGKLLKGVSEKRTIQKTDLSEKKALYRKAIVQIHPNKFVNHPELFEKHSHDLTMQLIDTYQNGDIEQLRNLYDHIMSGNAMAAITPFATDVPDVQKFVAYLTEKRNGLLAELGILQQSRLYEALVSGEPFQKFLDDLEPMLLKRIKQLEKRTRYSKIKNIDQL